MVTLIVMRHAKSSWKTEHIDHDRPLSGRGRRQGYAAGRWLVENHPEIDTVLCSTSHRTRETLERLKDAGLDPRSISFHDEIYESSPADILPLLRRVPADDRTVLLIGHYPAVEMLVEDIAGEGALTERFVTSGIATLEIDGGWESLETANARLLSFIAPGRD